MVISLDSSLATPDKLVIDGFWRFISKPANPKIIKYRLIVQPSTATSSINRQFSIFRNKLRNKEMELITVTLLAMVAFAAAGPISVSNNNVGDIVTVDFNVNAVVSNNIDQNIISVIAALLNQQAIGISGTADAGDDAEAGETLLIADDSLLTAEDSLLTADDSSLTADSKSVEEILEESDENESPKYNIPPELIEKVKGLFNKH